MRITQGTFAFLPDLTDEEIAAQIQYAIDNGWAISVECTPSPTGGYGGILRSSLREARPGPRDNYWDMWGLPMFDTPDASAALHEINECRRAFPDRYIRVSAYDSRFGRQTTALSFLVNRPQ
jgi:ribulose-bisphosphate carboxylase small chain